MEALSWASPNSNSSITGGQGKIAKDGVSRDSSVKSTLTTCCLIHDTELKRDKQRSWPVLKQGRTAGRLERRFALSMKPTENRLVADVAFAGC